MSAMIPSISVGRVLTETVLVAPRVLAALLVFCHSNFDMLEQLSSGKVLLTYV